MASDDEQPRAADDRSMCTPCRGTGKLISNLGGDAHEVVCPWCGGLGKFESGRDAQSSGPADQRN